MQLEFDITQSFNDDLNYLSEEDKKKIKDQINFVSGSLLNGKEAFFENTSKPYLFKLKENLESSLYVIKADNKRIVAAVDEDPIFDKLSFTLFRITDKENAEQVYREIGEIIYKHSGIL
ncbi:hypothetical protein [Parafilimonas sp.]|uniref:hypothetical protein n=1 Tax=Parafilimonas sp. TaxID=1969739 RepID=UPI0039E39C57